MAHSDRFDPRGHGTAQVRRLGGPTITGGRREGFELLVELVRDRDLDAQAVREYRAGAGYSMPMAGIVGDGYRPKVEFERRIAGYPLAPPDPSTTVSLAAVRALASRRLAADRVVFSASETFAVEHVRRGGTDRLLGWLEAVVAVTAADVKRVPQEYLDPAAFVTVVAGPMERIRAARHPRWPVALDELEAELSGAR